MTLDFQRVNIDGIPTAYAAAFRQWNFLIICDGGSWTTSYRLADPKGTVSASSTIRGPFQDFSDAVSAAYDMLAELRRLS